MIAQKIKKQIFVKWMASRKANTDNRFPKSDKKLKIITSSEKLMLISLSYISHILLIYNLNHRKMHNLSLQIYNIFTLLVYNLQASELNYSLQIYKILP